MTYVLLIGQVHGVVTKSQKRRCDAMITEVGVQVTALEKTSLQVHNKSIYVEEKVQ